MRNSTQLLCFVTKKTKSKGEEKRGAQEEVLCVQKGSGKVVEMWKVQRF
jgi:hypothetical protein